MSHPDYTVGEWEHDESPLTYAKWVQSQIENAPSDFALVSDLAAHGVLSVFQVNARDNPQLLARLDKAISDIMDKLR